MSTDDDQSAVVSFLLGAGSRSAPSMKHARGVSPGAPGLIMRMLENYTGDPVGLGQQIALAGAAVGLTVPEGALSATINIEAQPVRVRFDSGVPTALVGLLLPVGMMFTIGGIPTLKAASFFTTVAGGIVNVTYWT